MSYESFWLLHGRLSAKIAKAVDNSRPYEQKGGRGVNISRPPTVMAPFPLAFGWLVLCGILLVACHMTSWQSIEFQKSQ
jgi:hypothetical protein